MSRRIVAVTLFVLAFAPGVIWAQADQSTEARFKALEQRIQTLEEEIQALKSAQPAVAQALAPDAPVGVAPPPSERTTTTTSAAQVPATTVQGPAQAPGVPSAPLPVYGGASAAAKALNPDISIIGDFVGTAGRNPVQKFPSLESHESELGLQAIIDPYARGDFFFTFGERGVNLEEGYITFTGLPAGLVSKAGKFRSSFGVVNTLHNEQISWVDRPLVTENLVGGEDGISDAGISVSRILPAPKNIFLSATAQLLRGDSGDVFTATRRGDVSFVGHLRGYRDITESTNIDLGLSFARGHNDLGSAFITDLYGLDATLRWKPLRRAIYHYFLGRGEFVWSQRQQMPSTQHAFGFYTSADYRVSRRWIIGGRYDRSDRARNAALTDSGFSPVITYWPSEFSQVRAQYRFTSYADGRHGNDLLFQLIFVMGAHGAHPF